MKNIDYIIKIVAKNSSVPEEEINKINRFFWKNVKTDIMSHEETSLHIKGIGTVAHSQRKVSTEILRVIGSMRNMKKTRKFTEERREEILNNYATYLKQLLKHHNNFAVLRYNHQE